MRPNAPTYGNNDLTVVIPHFGSYDLLRRCLRELSPSRLATVVVEDGCYDEAIREEFPSVRFVSLSRNSGFAAACNRGLAEVDTACVAFLNNDVFVTAVWQAPLLESLASEVGLDDCLTELSWVMHYGYLVFGSDAVES